MMQTYPVVLEFRNFNVLKPIQKPKKLYQFLIEYCQ